MHAIYSDLKNLSVFITGGGSGIGAVITEGFLRQGAKVAFIGRKDASVFVSQIAEKTGNTPLFLQGDISDISQLNAAIKTAEEQHGPVRVLVNNAADDMRHATLSTDEAYWDWSTSINLKAQFFAAKAVIPGMRNSGGGTIVQLTSISYMMGQSGYPVYTTSNAGLNGMVRSLAREFGPDKIRVNALVPGWVLTEKQLEKWANPESLAAHLERQCLKEHLKPHDILGAALFLASDASRMMTGQALVIDGGVVVTG